MLFLKQLTWKKQNLPYSISLVVIIISTNQCPFFPFLQPHKGYFCAVIKHNVGHYLFNGSLVHMELLDLWLVSYVKQFNVHMCICYRLDLPCLLWKYISDHFIIMLWHLPWVVQNNWIPESPYDISTAQVECQWLKDGLLNILTVVWIMYYIWTAFFFSIFTFLHWVMLLSSVNYNERAVKPSVPCSVILHRDTWYMVSLYTWVQLQDNFSNHQASLFLLGLSLCIFNCVYVWDIQHVWLGVCACIQ